MKKKVLLLSQIFPPEGNTGANRAGAMADALSKEYDVYVVTLKPSYPSPTAYEGFPTERYDAERPYTVKRTFAFHPHRGGLLVRAFREHLMCLGLTARAMPISADIVVASSPSMFL